MRKKWPKNEMMHGLGHQQIRHIETYTVRMHEEMQKVDTPEEKLEVAEQWHKLIGLYLGEARKNVYYENPDPDAVLYDRGEE